MAFRMNLTNSEMDYILDKDVFKLNTTFFGTNLEYRKLRESSNIFTTLSPEKVNIETERPPLQRKMLCF